jgi:hypothetical protein
MSDLLKKHIEGELTVTTDPPLAHVLLCLYYRQCTFLTRDHLANPTRS